MVFIDFCWLKRFLDWQFYYWYFQNIIKINKIYIQNFTQKYIEKWLAKTPKNKDRILYNGQLLWNHSLFSRVFTKTLFYLTSLRFIFFLFQNQFIKKYKLISRYKSTYYESFEKIWLYNLDGNVFCLLSVLIKFMLLKHSNNFKVFHLKFVCRTTEH